MYAKSVIAVAATVLLYACSSDHQAASPRDGTGAVTTSYAHQTNYAQQSTSHTWPEISGSQDAQQDPLAQNYYIVFDGSGSMAGASCTGTGNRMAVAKQAVNQFVNAIPSSANIGLFVFDRQGNSERVPLAANNHRAVETAINAVIPGGLTPLKSSLEVAMQAVQDQAERQLGYGNYNIVVVTDGQASAGQDPADTINHIVNNSPVMIHTIGFCLSGSHSLNQAGRTLYYSATDTQSLTAGLASILAESDNFDPTIDAF